MTCRLQGGLRMRISSSDQWVSRAVFVNGVFEPAELDFIRRHVTPGMTVFDVGANIGVHTLTLAAAVGPTGVVHAFEPSRAFDLLMQNVALNDLGGRTRLNRCAVGRANGSLTLVQCKPGCEAFTSHGGPLRPEFDTGERFEVPMISLDTYAHLNGLDRVDFLKVDVEGSEPDVVRGAAGLLARHAIKLVMFEVNETCLANSGSSPAELVEQLSSAGFALHLLASHGPSPCRSDVLTGDWNSLVGKIATRQ